MSKIAIKVSHNQTIKKLGLSAPISWADFSSQVAGAFHLSSTDIRATYRDEDGDVISVDRDSFVPSQSNNRLSELQEVVRAAEEEGKTARLEIVSPSEGQQDFVVVDEGKAPENTEKATENDHPRAEEHQSTSSKKQQPSSSEDQPSMASSDNADPFQASFEGAEPIFEKIKRHVDSNPEFVNELKGYVEEIGKKAEEQFGSQARPCGSRSGPFFRSGCHVGRVDEWRGVTCDGCQTHPIIGSRWKCEECDDYDLCGACHPKASSIHESKASHSFSELKDYGDLKIFHVNKKLVELNAMGFFGISFSVE